MNIKDSYLHGGTHVMKNIQFSIAASGTNKNKLVATITWAEEGSSDTELAIPISGATFGSLTKNTVFAAPSDSNGAPSFRSLVAADIPDLSASKITSGTIKAARLPLATSEAKGAVILGVAADNTTNITGKLYWVKMNANGKIYVDVPWVWTQYVGATANADGTEGYIPAATAGDQEKFFRADGTWQALGSNAFTSTAYLPLTGGTLDSTIGEVLTIKSTYNSDYSCIVYQNKSNNLWTSGINSSDNYYFYSGTKSKVVAYITNTGNIYAALDKLVYHSGNIPSNAKSTAGIVAGPGAGGKVYISNSSGAPIWDTFDTTVTSGSSKLVTSGAVYTAISNVIASSVLYLGTVATSSEMTSLTEAKKGDFARVITEFSFTDATGVSVTAHVGDVVYLTNDTPGTAANWIVAHTEIDTDTWTAASTDAAGYVPKLATGGTELAASSTDYVLAYVSGATTPAWKKLPSTAYADTVRPIYSEGTSRYNSTTKTGINFIGSGATSVTFLAAGTDTGQSGNASYGTIKISSNNDLVKFSATTNNTEYYLPVRAKNTTDTAQQLYRTGIVVKNTTITASLSGNASTASNLSKGDSRGYLYQSAGTTTGCTGVGNVSVATEIGIPYIGFASPSHTYGIYKDLFYLSGTTKYIHGNVHSTKFACIKTLNSTTDDWDGSSTSGSSSSGGGTTYSAGDGISINGTTISTTKKEWFGTEALFNSLASLDSNTTYYIMN